MSVTPSCEAARPDGTDRRDGTERRDFSPGDTRKRKLTFKEQRELDGLSACIEALEIEQARLGADMAAPYFYKRPAAEIHAAMARLEALPAEIEAAMHRWDELETVAQAGRTATP